MAAIRIPKMKFLYFYHKKLICIHAQPHVGSLHTLYNELMAKASTVPTIVGIGAFGHLCLLLTEIQYATLLQIPFVRPTNPGAC